MTLLRSNQHAYSKIDKEDPEEVRSRRAQFLIYKVLDRVDSRRKPSFLRIRLCRLKVKIGKRLKKLRKSMLVSVSAARISFYKQAITQLKTWKRFFGPAESNIATLPAFFK
ncbi:Rhodanese-like domain-containing protein [Melia azedarach]|uniref:Rhodanese-like domain-containing protein n=1 Tax=Melia azedarach TaxID=155640 RepID=A0ACC1WVG6_MELAZ|nr:Rhodanese-like domain-containing protein [Melia azedarach]